VKRTGNRRRGNDAEQRAQAYLERLGYLCHRAVQTGFRTGTGKWLARSNDVWGEFDLLASRYGTRVLCVQVTASPGAAAEKRRGLEALAPKLNLEHMDVQLWVWHPGKPTKRSKFRQTWTGEEMVGTVFQPGSVAWAPLDMGGINAK
jgi:Holliday junction resolvase-like predicted endonuclease